MKDIDFFNGSKFLKMSCEDQLDIFGSMDAGHIQCAVDLVE